MANVLKGEVELIAGDKSYVLRFSVDAICSLEEQLGKGFPAIAVEMQDIKSLKLGMLRHLLHAGLKENHPDITLKEAGELIVTGGGMIEVSTKLGQAIIAAFPQQPEASGTRRPRKGLKGQTGLNS